MNWVRAGTVLVIAGVAAFVAALVGFSVLDGLDNLDDPNMILVTLVIAIIGTGLMSGVLLIAGLACWIVGFSSISRNHPNPA